jgi:hypothetical protein
MNYGGKSGNSTVTIQIVNIIFVPVRIRLSNVDVIPYFVPRVVELAKLQISVAEKLFRRQSVPPFSYILYSGGGCSTYTAIPTGIFFAV